MKRRSLCLLLVLVVMACCVGTAYAAMPDPQPAAVVSPRASNSFSMEVPAGEIMAADTSFSMAIGETVTIDAVYSPTNASLDVGLIAPDGRFYSVPVSDGKIDESFKINLRGKYTFAVRNNADFDVAVTGFVNY